MNTATSSEDAKVTMETTQPFVFIYDSPFFKHQYQSQAIPV